MNLWQKIHLCRTILLSHVDFVTSRGSFRRAGLTVLSFNLPMWVSSHYGDNHTEHIVGDYKIIVRNK
jgi:hypothetical protein